MLPSIGDIISDSWDIPWRTSYTYGNTIPAWQMWTIDDKTENTTAQVLHPG